MRGYVVRGNRTLANEFTDSILNNADLLTSLNRPVGVFLRPETLRQVSTVLNSPPRVEIVDWVFSAPNLYSCLAFGTLLGLTRYLSTRR